MKSKTNEHERSRAIPGGSDRGHIHMCAFHEKHSSTNKRNDLRAVADLRRILVRYLETHCGGQLLNPCPLQTNDTSLDKIPESSFSPVHSEIKRNWKK